MLKNGLTVQIFTLLLFTMDTIVDAFKEDISTISLGSVINSFGTHLYKEVIKTEDNVFFSPLSVAVILNILLIAARNETAQELMNFMRYESPDEREQMIRSLHKFLELQKEHQDGYELDVTNSMWIQDTVIFPAFKSIVEKFFFSKEIQVDFSNPSTVDEINNWVNKETKGKIKSIVDSNLSPMTKILLINALYFKGKWAKRFDSRLTKYQPFYSSDPNLKTQVPMMKARGKFKYSDKVNLNAQVLELPYEGKTVRMVIILPRKGDGLDDIEMNLSSEMLMQTVSNMTDYRLHVSVPKFNISSSLDLKKNLMSLGVERIFLSGVADLSHIDGQRDKYVSSILQKAIVEVNEEGTVAAAVSKVDIVARTITPDFTADRPFMFVIQDIPTGIFLFMGRVKQL